MMYLTGLEGTDQRSFVLSMLMLENSGSAWGLGMLEEDFHPVT